MPTPPSAAVWPRAILHVDMDAFFVNVHLLDHPEDKGLPLAVGGRPEQRGVVASASYEARAHGVRSAMPMSRALRLCRNLKIVSADWARIRSASKQVMALLASYGPLEKMSVDEAYIDISNRPNPELLAIQIQTAVKHATELPCSVGLATCKLVAKVASDHDKPAGCTIVAPGSEAAFLAPLPTRVLHGIGPATAERLTQLGINTCAALAQADAAQLEAAFGRHGPSLIRRAQGIDNRPVVTDAGLPKSISQENTFNQDVSDRAWLLERLQEMAQRVATSLQKQQLVAHTVTVKFRSADFTTFSRQRTVQRPFDDADALFSIAVALFDAHWPPGTKLRLLGVGVSSLSDPAVGQLPLPLPEFQ